MKLTLSLNLPVPRLKVISYRLNEVWSIDLADMQQVSGVRYLFVAVDTLSRFLWVVSVKSKTSKACSEALKKIISTNKQRNAPKIFASKKFPEKIWADQGKEFAGEFAAVAERYIRTLKTLIFKYLHESDTNRYIDQLEKFVSIINNRINRMTKLAPIEVSQKDVPYLISLCNTVPPQRPKFKVGDRVRIRQKIENFHRGYRIQFTEELFTHTFKKPADVRCE